MTFELSYNRPNIDTRSTCVQEEKVLKCICRLCVQAVKRSVVKLTWILYWHL